MIVWMAADKSWIVREIDREMVELLTMHLPPIGPTGRQHDFVVVAARCNGVACVTASATLSQTFSTQKDRDQKRNRVAR